MSTPTGQPPAGGPPQYVPATAAPTASKPPIGTYIKVSIWTLAVVLVVLFVLLNKASVTINFIFFDAVVPLIFVLLGCVIIGALLGMGFMMWRRRRAARRVR